MAATETELSKIHYFRGNKSAKGPTSVVFAGVHGNETPGIEAGRQLLPHLQENLEFGTVIFAWGNPRAIILNERLVPKDENLNRMFQKAADLSPKARKSYAYQRAQELKPSLLIPGVALLDLHGTSNSHTQAHVICEPNGYSLASVLPVNIVVSGFDEHEPGGTDYFANAQGNIGICVEPGWNEDINAIGVAFDSAQTFLMARGHTSGETTVNTNQTYYRLSYAQVAEAPYIPADPVPADFSEVTPGQLMGYEGTGRSRREIRVPDNIAEHTIVLFAASKRKPGQEDFLLAQQINPQEEVH